MSLFQFPYLPLELVRIILEIAANHRPTALSLCVVSKDFHRWITPILYRTVTLLLPDNLRRKIFKAFPHGDLVKNLYISREPTMIQFRKFTMLKNLAIPDYSLRRLNQIPATVTHLTMAYSPEPRGDPSFSSITHLYLIGSKGLLFFHRLCWTQPKLPHLTHVVCGMDALPNQIILSRFLGPLSEPTFDKLRVIGLQMLTQAVGSDPERILTDVVVSVIRTNTFRNDDKIVVLPGETEFNDSHWKEWFQSGEDVWEKAERLLSSPAASVVELSNEIQ